MDEHIISKRVRLKEFEINSIISSFRKYFSENDSLWLFGSRIDLKAKGGDIDLYIETTLLPENFYQLKTSFTIDICDKTGDQRIDVLIKQIGSSENLPIYKIAKLEGVKLYGK